MEKVLLSLLFVIILSSDTFWNGSKTVALMPEVAAGIWLMAVYLAWSAPVFEFYSRGDKFVRNVAKSIATVSVAINLISGYATIESKSTNQSNDYQLREEKQARLAKDYSDEKMMWCFHAHASVCKHKEKSEEKKALEAEIDALSHARVGTIDHGSEILGYLLIFGLATLPFAGIVCGRLLARVVKLGPTVNNLYEEPTKPEPKNDSGSENKKLPETPGASTPRSVGSESPKKPKRREWTVEDIPTNEEADRIAKAYKEMNRKGEGVTKRALAKKAKIRERRAAYWLDHLTEEDRAAMDSRVVPYVVK